MSTLSVKARRDVRRQRAQFVAIAITVLLGVALFAASYDAFRGLEASYQRAYSELRFANLTLTGGDTAAIEARARGTPGVEAVYRRLQADLPMRVGETKFFGRMIGLPPEGRPEVNRIELESGKSISPAHPDRVLVEQHMADDFDLATGDRIEVSGARGPIAVTIAGIVASPEYFWPAPDRQNLLPAPKDFGVVFAFEQLAERLAASGPNQVAVYYEGGEPNAALTRGLSAAAQAAGATDAFTRADQPSNSALQEDVDSFRSLAVLFPLLFLTAAALAVSVLMRRLVTAQRPIIGMLRACGYSRGQIVGHYLLFGLAAGLVGGLLGALGGVLLAGVITDAYVRELSIPVTVVEVSPVTLLFGLAFGLGATLLASALPARSAAQIPPAEAMRPFVPRGGGRISLAERAFPPLRGLPARALMVLRSIGRNRMRTLSTVLGVVLALCLILVSWGMVDTTEILVERQFNEVDRKDAGIYFRSGLTAEQLRRVERIAGVSRAEASVELAASVRADERIYQTKLVGLDPDTQMHGFRAAGGGSLKLPATGALAGRALREELDVDTGSEIELALPGGRTATLTLAGFVSEPLGTYLYASRAQVLRAGGPALGDGNVALVRYQPGVDRDTMRKRLSALPGVVAFSDSRALYEQVNSYLALYYMFVGIMLVFGGAMAFALMFNAMTSNISERAVEVATMRAAGARYRSLARMISAENVLVTLLGIAPGLIAGYELARLFMAQYTNDQFDFSLQMRTSTFVLAALAIVAVALLSQLPGLRAVRRLDIAGVVRERAT